MQQLHVGDSYPVPQSTDPFTAHIVGNGFNVVGIMPDLQGNHIHQINHSTVGYGTITLEHRPPLAVDEISQMGIERDVKVPFLLLDFFQLDWQIRVPFNMQIGNELHRQNFLENDSANCVNFVVCEPTTGDRDTDTTRPRPIRAVRDIYLRAETMRDIKASCREQLESGRYGPDIRSAITALYSQSTTKQMIEQAEMVVMNR